MYRINLIQMNYMLHSNSLIKHRTWILTYYLEKDVLTNPFAKTCWVWCITQEKLKTVCDTPLDAQAKVDNALHLQYLEE